MPSLPTPPGVPHLPSLAGEEPAEIHFQVSGAGAPVVLVHGLSGSARWWARNAQALSRRFRVYTINLIGFGGNRADRPFILSEAAQHLVAWMDRLGLERASFVGHSMGGYVTAALAADFPQRVERLVLVAAAALPPKYGYLGGAAGLLREVPQLPPSFLPVLVADAWQAGPLTLLNAARDLTTDDLTPRLWRVRAPTLLVWGERDRLVPPVLGQQIARLLSGTRACLVTLPAGHLPMWEQPHQFNQLVSEFLAGQGSGLEVADGVGGDAVPLLPRIQRESDHRL